MTEQQTNSTNDQKEGGTEGLDIESENIDQPNTSTDFKQKYIILAVLSLLFCGGIIALIVYLTNSENKTIDRPNETVDDRFGFELEPGGIYNFESGNFSVKNTTNIIRSWMILNCSSSHLILHLNSTKINSYNIGSALLSIGLDIYCMPNECPVILGEIMNKTMNEYDETIYIEYNAMETLFDEIFEDANFNINGSSPFFILNKDDLISIPSISSRSRLLDIDFDETWSFSYDLVDKTWNFGKCELSFKYTMKDATINFLVDVRKSKINEISFLLDFIGVSEISFGDCGSFEIPINIEKASYKIEKKLLFFNPFPIYIELSLEAKPKFIVQIVGSVISTNSDEFQVGFQYILENVVDDEYKTVFILNNKNKDDDNAVSYSKSSSDSLDFVLNDCTYSLIAQFINELIVGIEFYGGLINYQLPNIFTFEYKSTFPSDKKICSCLDEEDNYYQSYQFKYLYQLSHKLDIFYSKYTPIEMSELYSNTLYESDKKCGKALFQSFLKQSLCFTVGQCFATPSAQGIIISQVIQCAGSRLWKEYYHDPYGDCQGTPYYIDYEYGNIGTDVYNQQMQCFNC
eukprot:514713_1